MKKIFIGLLLLSCYGSFAQSGSFYNRMKWFLSAYKEEIRDTLGTPEIADLTAKANVSDTGTMLNPYRTGLVAIPTKVKYTDSSGMLNNYRIAMIAAAAGLLLKLNISDTVGMLNNYKTGLVAIPTKLAISDTGTMLNNYRTAMISAKGYSINVQALTSSPTDGQTIYFGTLPKAPVTAQGTSRIYIRKPGIIKIVEIYCYSGTAGSNEAWVLSIRLNNSGDTQIASVSASTNERVFSNTSLSIAVSAGDYVEIKSVNPTWVTTNPLTTIFGGYIYIE